MTIQQTNIVSRSFRADVDGAPLKVNLQSNWDKNLNAARGYANLTSVFSGAAAAVWGVAKLATQFALTTNRVSSYLDAKQWALYAVPLNMIANAVRVGVECKSITNVTAAKKRSGAGLEALMTTAGLMSTIFNGMLQRRSVNHPFLKNVPLYLTAIGVGMAAYNAYTSFPALNDDAIRQTADDAAKTAKDKINNG